MLRSHSTIATALLLAFGCSSGAGNSSDSDRELEGSEMDAGIPADDPSSSSSGNAASNSAGNSASNEDPLGSTTDSPTGRSAPSDETSEGPSGSDSTGGGSTGSGSTGSGSTGSGSTGSGSTGGSVATGTTGGGSPEANANCEIQQPSDDDSDGDGLDDDVEEQGWEVTVENGFGELNTRRVRSNPFAADSNGDGLCDREARQSFLDPNAEQGDTDGDGLSDIEERDRWASSPIDVDSDDDSQGDPRLFDGNEIQNQGTSPTISDSDGDGISDYKEIVELGNTFDPLLANTPQLQARIVGAPNVRANMVHTEGEGSTSSIETTLEQGTEERFASSDTQSHEAAVALSLTVSQETGFELLSPTVSVGFEATATAGYTYTNTQSVTSESAQSSREAYAEALEQSRTSGTEIDGGQVEIAVELKNVGDMTFTLGDYEITAILVDPNNPGAFKPLATMSLSDQLTDSGIGLGPGASAGPLTVSGELSTEEVLEVMARPELLRFEVANIALSYQNPDNSSARGLLDFEYLRQETNAKTALVQVDFGNGTVLRRRVATNVNRLDGRIVGVGLDRALTMLGLDFETEQQGEASVTKLARITDPEQHDVLENDFSRNYTWAIAGATTRDFDTGTHLGDITLLGGDAVYVMYVRDEDADNLFAREEYLHGTIDTDEDFDDDGITDGDEVKAGWRAFRRGGDLFPPVVPYSEATLVFSDPTSMDGDRDGLTDPEEQLAGTDPKNPDTDGDGYCDGAGPGPAYFPCPSDSDPDPLDPTKTGNRAPVIETAELASSGLNVTLDANVSDENDNILEVVIDWGDAETTVVSDQDAGFAGYDAIRISHAYASLGDYTVTITARDAFNETDVATAATSAATPTANLVAEYLFTAGSPADSSGAGSDGQMQGYYNNTGGCLFTDAARDGLANNALYFNDQVRADGACWETDTYFRTPAFGLSGEFSMSFWVRAPQNAGFILGQSSSANPTMDTWGYFHFGRDAQRSAGANSRMNFILPAQDGAPLVVSDPNVTSASEWTFYSIVVTTNGATTTAKLYRGTETDALTEIASESAAADYTNPRPTDPSFIGNLPVDGISHRALIDDVRFYGRGLSQGELDALFL